MKLFFLHFQMYLKTLFRQPAYVLSTLIFPSLFYIFFAQPHAKTAEAAHGLLAGFAGFSVLSVCFLDFGVSTSRDLASKWSEYLRTLPISNFTLNLARSIGALLFALLAALIVYLSVHSSSPADLNLTQSLKLFMTLVLGSLPFCLMALCIGYLVKASSALPVTNLLYLSLSFAGGLWLPPNALPELVQDISPYLPTRLYAELLWTTVFDTEVSIKWVLGLAAYSLFFGLLLKYLMYRRLNRA